VVPVALVEDEEAILACSLDEVADLGTGEERPAGGGARDLVVESADAKFVGVHGLPPLLTREIARRAYLGATRYGCCRAHGLSLVVDDRCQRSAAAMASRGIDVNAARRR
jgi:hypothetical protein